MVVGYCCWTAQFLLVYFVLVFQWIDVENYEEGEETPILDELPGDVEAARRNGDGGSSSQNGNDIIVRAIINK